MSQSNSSKMTMEEKLVQKIKELGISSLIDDEDSIITLTKRAITEALFQPTRVKDLDRWGGVSSIQEKESIVVDTAKGLVRQAVASLTQQFLEELLKNEEVKKAVIEAFAQALPNAIANFTTNSLLTMAETISAESRIKLMEVVMSNNLNTPNGLYSSNFKNKL